MSDKKPNQKLSIPELAYKALVSANAKLVRERQKEGGTLVIWRDGKVAHVPASELEIPKEVLFKKTS